MPVSGADPTIDGFVAPGYERVAEEFTRNFTERAEIGAAFAAFRHGEPVVDIWAGLADPQAGRPWSRDTVCLGYSMTKGVTAVIANRLIAAGMLAVDTPVASYWPEFAVAGKQRITVGELLSHRAGLAVIEGDFTLETALGWDPVVAQLAGQAPRWEPGRAHGYHLRSFGWLVGELIRRVAGATVGELVRRDIAGALDVDLWVGLPAEVEPRVARLVLTSEISFDRLAKDSLLYLALTGPSGLLGYGDRWNTRALHACELPSSNGIGDARAFATMYAATIDPGVGGKRLLDDDSVARATAVRSRGPDKVIVVDTGFGLGFMVPPSMPPVAGPRAFGHGGAGGSLAFADPDAGIACCYIMNGLHFDFAQPDVRALRLSEALYACVDAG
jgi:CubicO group peptidase (beta-lactamase class C family)